MKSSGIEPASRDYESLPARGVWIEIYTLYWPAVGQIRHSPQGECGLKCHRSAGRDALHGSLPARGVWIEIEAAAALSEAFAVTPRKGSVD